MESEYESRTRRVNDSFAWNPHQSAAEDHTDRLAGKQMNNAQLFESEKQPQLNNSELGTFGFSEGIPGTDALNMPIDQELLLKSQNELSGSATAPLPTFGTQSSMLVEGEISSTWVANEQRDGNTIPSGSDLAESVGIKPNSTESFKISSGSKQENASTAIFNNVSTHKRAREDGDAENYPPEKIPALEITATPTTSNNRPVANQKQELGNTSATLSTASSTSRPSQPALSPPTLPTTSRAPLSQPATPPTSGQASLIKVSGTSPSGQRDNTNRAFESVGNESHSDVMAMSATKMMATLRQRSVELDAIRDGIREWLCVLQPDLSLQLRARPWPEICRLFSGLLQANRST